MQELLKNENKNKMEKKIIEWFLRLSLSIGMLSAVADRFGFWNTKNSVWGNWHAFLAYTEQILYWLPKSFIPIFCGVATFLEVVLSLLLLTTFKTTLVAKATGILLLSFALTMTISFGIKTPLDYSVFSAAAAAFALSVLVKNQFKQSIY